MTESAQNRSGLSDRLSIALRLVEAPFAREEASIGPFGSRGGCRGSHCPGHLPRAFPFSSRFCRYIIPYVHSARVTIVHVIRPQKKPIIVRSSSIAPFLSMREVRILASAAPCWTRVDSLTIENAQGPVALHAEGELNRKFLDGINASSLVKSPS